MAYLKKEQYERRNENSAKRNIENSEKAVENGMTENQSELIVRLCCLRHDIHTNTRHIICGDEQGFKKQLVELNSEIHESGLIAMTFISHHVEDFIDIDTIDEAYDYEDENKPELGSDEYYEWYNSEYEKISAELEKLNTKIENYLSEIDSKYGTNFAPTGALRIF